MSARRAMVSKASRAASSPPHNAGRRFGSEARPPPLGLDQVEAWPPVAIDQGQRVLDALLAPRLAHRAAERIGARDGGELHPEPWRGALQVDGGVVDVAGEAAAIEVLAHRLQ